MEPDTGCEDNQRQSENKSEKNNIRKVDGTAPASKPEEFKKALDLVIEDFNLVKPTEIMMANRMVATFMQLQFIEKEIKKTGLYFGEKTSMRMNPMLDHQSKLQNDLMRFYRMFKQKYGNEDNKPQTFLDYLEDAKTKSKKINK